MRQDNLREFVPEPTTRGTIGILWSCTLTLIICFWSSLHPDVKNVTLGGRILEFMRAALAPEFYTSNAIYRYLEAKADTKTLQAIFPGWTLTHSFYANMGGLRLEGGSEDTRLSGNEDQNSSPITAPQLIRLANTWEIDGIPSQEFIQDKSKSNPTAKTIAMAQVLWFVLQLIARVAQHLPLSTLELSIIPYGLMTLISIFCHLSKPADVHIPTTIRLRCERTVQTSHDSPTRPKVRLPLYLTFCLLFAAWHCLAWNFYFPSTAERWLWRVSAVLSALIPIIACMLAMVICNTVRWNGIPDAVIGAIVIPHVVLRLMMVILMFAALRMMPTAVYETIQWTTFFPHI